MDENHCRYCKYYLQHYTLTDTRLIQVECGHCTWKTPMHKRPNKKACENFIPGIHDQAKFVSKQYLSKKLLERVLNMELLPEIEEFPV